MASPEASRALEAYFQHVICWFLYRQVEYSAGIRPGRIKSACSSSPSHDAHCMDAAVISTYHFPTSPASKPVMREPILSLSTINDDFSGNAAGLGAHEYGQAPVQYGPRTRE